MSELLLNPESEVVIFFGAKGKGKSSLMAHFVDDYLKTQGAQRWELSERLIREENQSGNADEHGRQDFKEI